MQSVLIFALLFGVVFALTEGSAIKTHQTQSLTKCNEKKIKKLMDTIIDDTYALKTDAYNAYEKAYEGALECVVSSFTTIVSCVKGVVEDQVEDFVDQVETYLNTVEALVQKIVTDMEECI